MSLTTTRLIGVLAALAVGTSTLVAVPAQAADSGGTLTGTVASATGDRLHRVSVRVYSRGQLIAKQRTTTAGRYTFTGLRGGAYKLRFVDVEKSYQDGGRTAFTSEWAENSTTRTHARAYRVRSGQTTRVGTSTMWVGTLTTVTATLDGQPVRPKDGVIVTFTDAQGQNYQEGIQAHTSTYSFERGTYTMIVRSRTDAFAPFTVTDLRDHDTTFRFNGVNTERIRIQLLTTISS